MKKKIPVSGGEARWQTPFAGLEMAGLRAGPAGEKAEAAPAAGESAPGSLAGESPVLRLERAGRGGKTVVVIGGFSERLGDEALEGALGALRRSLGLGGTRRGREIELNSSEPGRIRRALEGLGARPRGIG